MLSFVELSRMRPARLCTLLVGGTCLATGLSAATLTVKDETGQVGQLEIQSDNSVALVSSSSGNLTLTLDGYYVTISENPVTDTDGADANADADANTDADATEDDGVLDTTGYCAGNDDDLADCRLDGVFDPWIVATGEVPIWIRDKKTEVFPFTLPARSDNKDVRYGYLQLTTPERSRDPVTEDIFHMWWSETPNGAPLSGEKCDIWDDQARINMVPWSQDPALAAHTCYLGAESRVLYLNFETRCFPVRYKGTCDSDNLQKSKGVYQFDVARYLKGY